jgi:hypothetical protein
VAEDRTLINETNERFWVRTHYKPGQRLDMHDPVDQQMARVWMQIYGQVKGYRDRTTKAAAAVHHQTHAPYVFVAETPQGYVAPASFPRREEAEAQYQAATAMPQQYTYIALFDFAGGPLLMREQFLGRGPEVMLREHARDHARQTSACVVGVALDQAGHWYTPPFENAAAALTWLNRVRGQPGAFVYAAYFDKDDARWPEPLGEALGHHAPPIPGGGY